MGCNAEQVHDDWDDGKLLVLGVMYNYLNENILKPGQTICMTPEQIQTKTGIKDSARINLIRQHLS